MDNAPYFLIDVLVIKFNRTLEQYLKLLVKAKVTGVRDTFIAKFLRQVIRLGDLMFVLFIRQLQEPNNYSSEFYKQMRKMIWIILGAVKIVNGRIKSFNDVDSKLWF